MTLPFYWHSSRKMGANPMSRDGEVHALCLDIRDFKATWQRAQVEGCGKNGVNHSTYHSAEEGLWIIKLFCLVDSAKSWIHTTHPFHFSTWKWCLASDCEHGGEGVSPCSELRTLRQFGLQLSFCVCLLSFWVWRITFNFHTNFHQAFSRQCYS